MNNVIGIGDVLSHKDEWEIIDVRSPAEFLSGHIPGAVNLPLFTDDERARVGTLYKQTSPESALHEGLKIAGSRMSELTEQAIQIFRNSGKPTLIHCWRGGKRSDAVHWLFTFSGIPASKLEGGYKSYRTAAQHFFNHCPFELKILGGCTGSGKTEILKEIASRGHQVIDLEKLACHKGSAFGSIGEENQPSTEQFENDLFAAFYSMDSSLPVWLENESKSIGKVHIPDGLWHKMKNSVLYNIDVSREERLTRILEYYSSPSSREMLHTAFEKIYKRIGGLDFQNAINALNADDLKTAASIALKYYDKSYDFQVTHWDQEKVIYLPDCMGVKTTADRLLLV